MRQRLPHFWLIGEFARVAVMCPGIATGTSLYLAVGCLILILTFSHVTHMQRRATSTTGTLVFVLCTRYKRVYEIQDIRPPVCIFKPKGFNTQKDGRLVFMDGTGGGGGHQGLGACASFVSKYFFALYVVSSEGGYRKRAFDVLVRTNRCLKTQMPWQPLHLLCLNIPCALAT